jgi:diadenosine tetraphosphate (Ap4A) HIT family hydrolase
MIKSQQAMTQLCLICDRTSKIKSNSNPFFVKELETGYVVVGEHQYYPGYTLFLCKQHVGELHELKPDFRLKFLQEMSDVAAAVYKAFKPKKVNYELLGNAHPHLHWHIFPRYEDDPNLTMPVWVVDKDIRNAPDTKPSSKQLQELKSSLLYYLK